MSEELKPCPFCGGEAEIWRAGERKTAWVACMGRCATLVSKEHTTDADAVAAWNRRTALAVEGTPEPVAWRTNIFESVNAGKLSRLILDADEVEDPDKDWQPLYTAPSAGVREALEVIESFIAETVDYMTRNNLGDPEKQHNVKWGRKVLAALRGQ